MARIRPGKNIPRFPRFHWTRDIRPTGKQSVFELADTPGLEPEKDRGGTELC